jgi:phosphatidylserine decarboxylase
VQAPTPGAPPVFVERPVERIVPDGFRLGALPFGLALVAALLGWGTVCMAGLVLAAFTLLFFRNPERPIPGDERTVVAPADGRVVEVGEIEDAAGRKHLRIGIFLSVFNVHVNRMPLGGRVEAVELGGTRFLAAFDRRAERENVRCALSLRTAAGEPFRVVQITGLVARRIVCHPEPGEWVARGARFGLIRFGSRTDVVLPAAARPRVGRGDRVRGGATIVAEMPGGAEGSGAGCAGGAA